MVEKVLLAVVICGLAAFVVYAAAVNIRGTEPGSAADLLEQVGLSDRLSHKPSGLSVGRQQRVALARVLANDPQVVLADEPTGNLDPETGEHVLDFLCEINGEGKTVVMVTHDPRAAGRARTGLRLSKGELVSLS
jgi:putative ABC transport system ATP-binding protein